MPDILAQVVDTVGAAWWTHEDIITVATPTGGTVDVQDNGTPVVSADTLNIIGATIVESPTGTAEITIPSGGGAGALVAEGAVQVTSGDISLNFTAITDLTATQINLPDIQEGDIVLFEASAVVGAGNSTKTFDAYIFIAGTRTNPFSVGVSASNASVAGHPGWFVASNSGNTAGNLTGQARYVITADDLDGSGGITVGLVTAGSNSTSRTLSANSNRPLICEMRVFRL
jgi:hypothetical protein